ncbi:MAG: ABC transporter ATP-binding protein, partial [Acidimicrobiia bacterium]
HGGRGPSGDPAMTGPVLTVEAVRKSYRDTVALDGVNLVVGAGNIVALLGPNGAGKTSLVSIIAGLRRPDSGQVRVCGVDVVAHPRRAQPLVGLAPQDTGVYLPLTVRDNLRFFGGLAGLSGRALRDRIDELAHSLGLATLLDRRAGELSGGERRRLHTALALVHRPALVLLDEPTVGADVRTRAEILALVRAAAEAGAAVVYSTHYLHEVEELNASVTFIDRGRVVAHGSLDNLLRAHGSSALELTFDGEVPAQAVTDCATVHGSTGRIPATDPAAVAAELLPRLGSQTTALRSIQVIHPSLESVFLSVTGREFAQQAVEAAA